MAVEHGFFAELKRRHMWRVAIAYAIAAWLIVQIATQVFPVFHMPDWTEQIVVILVVIGFPIIVALAWVYEITPEGVRRTEPAGSSGARPEHEARQIGRKLNSLIVVVLVVAVALMGWRLLVLRHAEIPPFRSPDAAQRNPGRPIPDSTEGAAASGLHTPSVSPSAAKVAASAVFNPSADSIVVLPFKNLSGDPKQQFFSDGITEELTDALGQNTGLTVIAWDTASRYSNGKLTPKEIGMALNVAHVLAGSIQREGDTVRVTTELIDTANGRQLWSAHYDDSMKNIFAVQDRIIGSIADTLKVRFAGMQAAPTLDPQAHELYLKGLAALNRYTAAEARNAQNYFEQALKFDPGYADAWAGLSYTYLQLSEISTLPLKDALPKSRAAAKQALTLDPRNANAWVDLGIADQDENRIAEARTEFEHAIGLDPSNAHAHMDYGLILPLGPGLAQFRESARLNPDSVVVQLNLASEYQDAGNWMGEISAARAMIKLSPHGIDGAFYLAFAYAEIHRNVDAVKAFDLVQPATALDRQLVGAGRLTYKALLQPALRSKASAALDQLREAKLSPSAGYGLLQLYLALDKKTTAMQMLPALCASGPVYCSDLAINPLWSPLHDDPQFEKLAKQYTTIMPGTAPISAVSH